MGQNPALMMLNLRSPSRLQGPVSIFGDESGTKAALASTRAGTAVGVAVAAAFRFGLGLKTVYELGVFTGAAFVCARE